MSMKRCFMKSKGHSKPFSTFWEFKKRFGRSCESDVLSRRMALWSDNLPSGRLKKRIWWSDVCRCRFSMRTHFVLPGHREKRLGRSRLSDVISMRNGLTTHYMSSGRLNTRFCRCSTELCFNLSKGHTNSFFASWTSKKASLTSLFKWRFNKANGTDNTLSTFWKS
jgi:hypothetical protein